MKRSEKEEMNHHIIIQNMNYRGPFPYNREFINQEIPDNCIGNYLLGNIDEEGFFIPRYVGRSDSDLKTRIVHSIGDYDFFMYGIASSPRDAFHEECHRYHMYGGPVGGLDNDIHPDKPDGDEAAECFWCKTIADTSRNQWNS